MDIVYVICIAIVAATIGFIAGMVMAVGPGSDNNLTREEERRLNKLVGKAVAMTDYRSVTLCDAEGIVDQVIIHGDWN